MAPPRFDENPSFLEGVEDLPVQEFVAQSGRIAGRVERLGSSRRSGPGPEETVSPLRQAEALRGRGMSMAEATRQLGISEVTFHRWRKEYAGISDDQLRRLKELEKENEHLCRAVSDLTPDRQILKVERMHATGPSAQLDRPESPDRAGQCFKAGMPTLRQMGRDFLTSGGPTSGAGPVSRVASEDLDQPPGAGQLSLAASMGIKSLEYWNIPSYPGTRLSP